MNNKNQQLRLQGRKQVANVRRAVAQAPRMNVQRTYEGPASSRSARRTGVPRLISQGENIICVNNEIAIPVTGTATTGVIPAGGAIRIMQFVNAATANFLNNTMWINKLALAYDKWVLEELTLEFIPSLPFTAGGMSSLFFDSDPSRTTAPIGVAATSGDMRAVSKQIYAESRLQVLRNQLNRLPQYETIAGTTVSPVANIGSINFTYDSIILSNAAAAGPISIGNVWMRYRIKFLNPSNSVA